MQSINTYEIYEQSLLNNYTMIKATASWCGPCKKIHPQVIQLVENEKYTDIHFYEYDIDEIDDCPLQECIRVVPTFLFFEKDKLVHTIKGTDIKSVTNYLDDIVENMKTPNNIEGRQKLKVIKSHSQNENEEVKSEEKSYVDEEVDEETSEEEEVDEEVEVEVNQKSVSILE
jgi:thiol-disulfide isomerase/thioredoxin